ncbi:MAG: GDP-mannose 4,6-dehydratase [Rubripirellula sp.]|nr:GDP-mannose 4,6-dehydratase [Rubripirellula sp.]
MDLDYDEYIEIDLGYFRPAEVDVLLVDATRAKEVMGWEATTTLEESERIMTAHDYDPALREPQAKRFDAERFGSRTGKSLM